MLTAETAIFLRLNIWKTIYAVNNFPRTVLNAGVTVNTKRVINGKLQLIYEKSPFS
jgi:hypothetical protein